MELEIVETTACVMRDSPKGLFVMGDCERRMSSGGGDAAGPRLRERFVGALPAGRYRIREVAVTYPDLARNETYVIETPFGPARVPPALVQVRHTDGRPVQKWKVN